MDRLFATNPTNTALMLQRLVLAVVIFPHGAQKLLGWYGGGGIDGTIGFFGTMGVPAPVAVLVALAESVGAVLLALGLLSRVAAAGIGLVMIGAIALVHAPHGFFMNWGGQQAGEGFEFHLLALGLAVPLAIWGGGRYAIDTLIARRLREPAPRWREAGAAT